MPVELKQSLTVDQLILLLQGLALQLEHEQGIALDELLAPVVGPVEVGLQFEQDPARTVLQLRVEWPTAELVRRDADPGWYQQAFESLRPAPPTGWPGEPADDPTAVVGPGEPWSAPDGVDRTEAALTPPPAPTGPLQIGDWVFDEASSAARADELIAPESAAELREALPVELEELGGEEQPGQVIFGSGVAAGDLGVELPGLATRTWPEPEDEPLPPDAAPPPVVFTPTAEPGGLLSWARTAAQRATLATELGVSPPELLRLLYREDLLRIPGVEVEDAARLVELGVAGTTDLGRREPEALAQSTARTPEELAAWIEQARSLPPVLE